MNGQLFLLDERGTTYTSVDFAKKVQSWTLNPSDTHIAIVLMRRLGQSWTTPATNLVI